MQLITLPFLYDRAATPQHHLDRLATLLGRLGTRERHGAVYGMAEPGQRVYAMLRARQQCKTLACFDQRGAEACPEFPIASPDALCRAAPLEIIINTTPPLHVLSILQLFEKHAPNALVILFFDPFLYAESAHDCYALYFSTLITKLSEEGQVYAESLRAHCLTTMKRHYDGLVARQGVSITERDALTDSGQADLGSVVEQRFEAILRHSGDRIADLLHLADQYPFFSLARDAAACLLARKGNYAAAVLAFTPAADRYPFCHRTLSKLAELALLAGDQKKAASLSRRAVPLVTAGSALARHYQSLPEAAPEAIAGKWLRREIRPALRPRSVRLHCAIPVWSREFIDLFMKVTLRSLLAPGNIPWAAKHIPVLFSIYCKSDEIKYIEQYSEYKALADLVPIKLIDIEEILQHRPAGKTNRYSLMSVCQDHALQYSRQQNLVTFFPLADLLFSADFMKHGLSILESGYDTIFFAGMRYSKESILRDVIPDFTDGLAIDAPAMPLFEKASKAIHAIYKTKIRDDHVEMHPNSYFATDCSGNIIQHFFACTPMFMAPPREPVSIAATLDADLGYSVTDGGFGNYYLIDDTENMLLLELTSDSARTGELQAHGANSIEACAHWLRHTIDPFNKLLGARSVILRQQPTPNRSPERMALAKKINCLIV